MNMDKDAQFAELKAALADWSAEQNMASQTTTSILNGSHYFESFDFNSLTTCDIAPITSLDLSSLNLNNLSTTSHTINLGGFSTGSLTAATMAPMTVNQNTRIDLQGEGADIVINGQSLSSWMQQIEQRLNILRPNCELEKDWDQLAELGQQYRELEQRIKERISTWQALNKPMPNKFEV